VVAIWSGIIVGGPAGIVVGIVVGIVAMDEALVCPFKISKINHDRPPVKDIESRNIKIETIELRAIIFLPFVREKKTFMQFLSSALL
jgi:hypothetical protein